MTSSNTSWHHDSGSKVIITSKRCDGLSTDLPTKYRLYHLTPICSWLRTKRSMMWFLQPMIIKLSMSRPCAEQTVVAMLICKLSKPRLLLTQIMHEQSCSSIFVFLLLSIDQMSFVTPHQLLLPHCLCRAMQWVKIINVSMEVQFTVKSVMFTMFPQCQCPTVLGSPPPESSINLHETFQVRSRGEVQELRSNCHDWGLYFYRKMFLNRFKMLIIKRVYCLKPSQTLKHLNYFQTRHIWRDLIFELWTMGLWPGH